LPLPLDPEVMVIQLSLLVADQEQPPAQDTEMLFAPPPSPNDALVGETT
jgi:hypothetical protein